MTTEPGSGHRPALTPPRGFFQARVDDKGRLKLPAAIREYLASFESGSLFITTFDGEIVKAYPVAVWQSNEQILEDPSNDREDARTFLFMAAHNGGDSEIDSNGRIILPLSLRRQMNLENSNVRLLVNRGVIDIYSEDAFQKACAKAAENIGPALDRLRQNGLK